MKSSSNRDPNQNRPQVRSASPRPNANANPNPNAQRAQGQRPQSNISRSNMFTEEPYHDLNDSPASGTPVEEPFDYSMMGRPNSSAVVSKKKPSQRSSSSRSSSSRSSSSQASRKSSAPSRAPAKKGKKKSSGNTTKVLAIAAASVAIVAGIVGILFALGVFKPRIEVTMADGTVQKIKAEDAYAELTEGDKFYDGTIVNDINLGGMTKAEAYNAVTAGLEAAPLNVDIDLKVKEEVYDLDLSSLALTVNTNEVLDEAFAVNRPTDPEDLVKLKECYDAYQRQKNVHLTYQTAYTCATEGLTDLVHGVLDPLQVTEENAVITGFDKDNNTFVIQPEVNGFKIDGEKAVNDVKGLLEDRIYQGIVEVDSEVVVPEVTQMFINDNFGRRSTCTSTASNNKNRNTNLSQACKNIDGTILNPGDEFSFNGVVGQRTAANGFVEATVITGGQYEQGMGGGICQVSTMVYGAAVKADLEIVNRKYHAWPSSYVDPGLDATVDWGSIDLVFKNNTDYQIVIRAEFNNSDRSCTVSIYGMKLPDGQYIKFEGEITQTTPHGETEYVSNPNLAVGETNTLRNAHDGLVVKTYKIWYSADGTELRREDVATCNYRMWVKKVEVGTKLPGGGQAQFDPKTGKVTTPSPTATSTPTPAPATPPPTDPPAPPTETPPDEGGGDN